MNEMAERLGMDPVQFRILNEPKLDESLNLPFSSRHYLECLNLGAQKFGWSKRNAAVGSMKRDGLTLGWGMAGAAWIAGTFAAETNLELLDDGTVRVACATQDIGTGTYTILAQLASQKTGVPMDKIDVELGDSALPDGPISGGSLATSSVIPAVFKAAYQAITSLLIIAVTTPGSPFLGHKPDDLTLEGGRVFVKAEGPARGIAFADVLRGANARLVTGNGRAEQTAFAPNQKFSKHSFGCHFVEVTWQPETARLRVGRVVTVMDAGRILNPLAGRNQIQGAVVMGYRHGAVRRNHLRSAERCAHQQQSGGLHDDGERRRAPDRRAFPRLPGQRNQLAGGPGDRRDRPCRNRCGHHRCSAPCDWSACARTASEDREFVGVTHTRRAFRTIVETTGSSEELADPKFRIDTFV